MSTVQVQADHPYQVLIGRGVRAELAGLLPDRVRVAIIHPEVLGNAAGAMAAQLEGLGHPTSTIVVPDSEAAKTPSSLARCWDLLAAAGFTRDDVVVGLGGGSTTDLAGFVAASWLRGVAFVSMPTTVLGMVDAAVGGKTGINIAAGKNLVGAFHEPLGVLCDLELLDGLPPAEVSSGLAEVAKCGFIADPRILDLIESDTADARDTSSVRFAELVHRAVSVKAEVVSVDLREQTSSGARVGREALNYGHTLGHAIEQLAHFTWRHGEAISVGMVFAAELSARELGLSPELVERHRGVLASLNLPIHYNAGRFADLRQAMNLDKKARGATLRFVGLRDLASVEMISGPGEDVLAECFETLG